MGARLCFVVMMACLSWSCAGDRARPDAKPVKSSFIPAAEWGSERSEEVLISVLSDVFYINGERLGRFVVNPEAPWTPVSAGFDEALKRAAAQGAKSCLIVMSQDVKVASLVSVDSSCVRHISKDVSLGRAEFNVGADGALGVNLLMRTKIASAEDNRESSSVSINYGRGSYSIFIDDNVLESGGACSNNVSVCNLSRTELDRMLVERIKAEIKGRKESWLPVLQLSPNDSVGDIAVVVDRLRAEVGEPMFALTSLKGCTDNKRTDEVYGVYKRFNIPPMLGDFCDKGKVLNAMRGGAGMVAKCFDIALKQGREEVYGRWVVQWVILCDGSASNIKVVERPGYNETDVEQCLMSVVEGTSFMTPNQGGVCIVEFPFLLNAE